MLLKFAWLAILQICLQTTGVTAHGQILSPEFMCVCVRVSVHDCKLTSACVTKCVRVYLFGATHSMLLLKVGSLEEEVGGHLAALCEVGFAVEGPVSNCA